MNKWHLTNIPKLFFAFWGTQEFPWIRYLTLETFRKHHPDWTMILYKLPVLQNYGNDYKGKSYWDKLDDLNIIVEDMDIEKEMGVKFPPSPQLNLPYITCLADTMRYIALNSHGGFYIDLDNLFFRSLEQMPWNTQQFDDRYVFILDPPFHHIILGVPGAPYYDKVLDIQKRVLSGDPSRILDTTGCTMNVRRSPEDNVHILPMSTTEDNFNSNGPINEYALCLNWHGSGTYGKYQHVSEDNYKVSTHPLAACVRYCLHEDMGIDNGIGGVSWIARDDLGW